MKVLIIEDEPRAANQLQKILSECNVPYKVLDIIDSVEEATNWFVKNPAPDLVFMDIQLADGLSFEIFQKVTVDCPIIFTTAFDQYAIKAFKFNSVDYLLKPVKQRDLQVSLDKFIKNKKAIIDQSSIASLVQMMQGEKNETREGILVKEGSGFVQIKVKDINYLYSSDSITFAVTSTKRYILDETMDKFLLSVKKEMFFRINRGQAVKKTSILRLEPYTNHRLLLKIENVENAEFIVSRQKTPEFKQWMNS